MQNRFPRSVALLGSTGSIGGSALDVIRRQPELFRVAALAGARNIALLAQQAAEFRPPCLAVLDAPAASALQKLLPAGYTPEILYGQDGYETLAALPEADTILSAQVGAAGLRATCAAVRSGKIIALANKESLVLAGNLIRNLCVRTGASILPVDSEHNALFQCLTELLPRNAGTPGHDAPPALSRLILTASGGPFFGKSKEELARVTVEQALAHPNWTMGAKITIDSSTLMNKGLEVIEAHHLYGLPLEAVDVLVHRESVIHSLVEFADGSQLAQMGRPDMRIPIAHCLAWPRRVDAGVPRLDLAATGSLTFARPDEDAFPCLALARQAQANGNGSPVVLNAANEEAVAAFLERKIGYPDIARTVESCLAAHASGAYLEHNAQSDPEDVDAILALDAETRRRAQEVFLRHGRPQLCPVATAGAD